jgi:hypothetical protein
MPLIVSSLAACACACYARPRHSRLETSAAALIFFLSEYFMSFPV